MTKIACNGRRSLLAVFKQTSAIHIPSRVPSKSSHFFIRLAGNDEELLRGRFPLPVLPANNFVIWACASLGNVLNPASFDAWNLPSALTTTSLMNAEMAFKLHTWDVGVSPFAPPIVSTTIRSPSLIAAPEYLHLDLLSFATSTLKPSRNTRGSWYVMLRRPMRQISKPTRGLPCAISTPVVAHLERPVFASSIIAFAMLANDLPDAESLDASCPRAELI